MDTFSSLDAEGMDDPLYRSVRRTNLSGKSLWSMVAFLLLSLLTTAFLMLTILHGLDLIIAIATLGPEVYGVGSREDADVAAWLETAADRFPSLRGQTIYDLEDWLMLAILIGTFSSAHYFRFSKPGGESLLANPNAKSVISSVLAQFGYFEDIRVPKAGGGGFTLDFMAIGRVFYAPMFQVRNIVKGKKSDNQQRLLTFFMAHEFAHVDTRDNLINSVFVVAVSLYIFVFLAISSPFLLPISLLVVVTPWSDGMIGQLVTLSLSFVIFLSACGVVALCFHGMLVSYIKAREFFADRAAYRHVTNVDPYALSVSSLRPESWSAFGSNISRYERGLHKEEQSLHARNLLVFLPAFALSIRTLYLLAAPEDWRPLVYLFDATSLIIFLIFYFTLPKRPSKQVQRPLLPWMVSLAVILVMLFAGSGALGLLKQTNDAVVELTYLQAVVLPCLAFFVGYLFAVGMFAVLRLFRSQREVKRKGAIAFRMGLHFLSLPGRALDYFIIILTAGALNSVLKYFAYGRFFDDTPLFVAIMFVLLLVFFALLYNQYKGQFALDRVRTTVVGLLSSLVIFAFAGLSVFYVKTLGEAQSDELVRFEALGTILVEHIDNFYWDPVLPIAAILAIFYLVLKALSFWARDTLSDIERNLDQVSYQ